MALGEAPPGEREATNPVVGACRWTPGLWPPPAAAVPNRLLREDSPLSGDSLIGL